MRINKSYPLLQGGREVRSIRCHDLLESITALSLNAHASRRLFMVTPGRHGHCPAVNGLRMDLDMLCRDIPVSFCRQDYKIAPSQP
jgi:hypothetical protein